MGRDAIISDASNATVVRRNPMETSAGGRGELLFAKKTFFLYDLSKIFALNLSRPNFNLVLSPLARIATRSRNCCKRLS